MAGKAGRRQVGGGTGAVIYAVAAIAVSIYCNPGANEQARKRAGAIEGKMKGLESEEEDEEELQSLFSITALVKGRTAAWFRGSSELVPITQTHGSVKLRPMATDSASLHVLTKLNLRIHSKSDFSALNYTVTLENVAEKNRPRIYISV